MVRREPVGLTPCESSTGWVGLVRALTGVTLLHPEYITFPVVTRRPVSALAGTHSVLAKLVRRMPLKHEMSRFEP